MNKLDTSFHPSTQYAHDDEIDLWQLIETLWSGKYWIIGITLALAALGFVYTLQAEEEWVAQAKVVSPDYIDHQQIVNYTQQLQPAFGADYAERIKLLKFNDNQEVFSRFITLFNSTDNKHEFLNNHPTFSEYLKSQQTEDPRRTLNNWVERISASTATKGATEEFDLSFSSWNADTSHTFLVDYVSFSNTKVINTLVANIEQLAAARTSELNRTLETLIRNTQSRIDNEIQLLNHSLVIATTAGINAPIVDPGTQDDFSINLGSKAIEAKLNELKAIKDLSVLEPQIIQVKNQLAALTNFDPSQHPTFNAYKYLETPSEPLSRDSPKKVLILLACILLGGIIGCIYVLIASAVKSHRNNA